MTTLALLVIVASIGLAGTSSAYAQEDPTLLLHIAKGAQDQIRDQISDETSNVVHRLFEESAREIDALGRALENDNVHSAKIHFLSAMKLFKEISGYLEEPRMTSASYDAAPTPYTKSIKDPSNNLQRLEVHVDSLRMIAQNHNASIDFTEINNLFGEARQQIAEDDFVHALQTLSEIKTAVADVKRQLHIEASEQKSHRANMYASKYLEQLDRLIENAKIQGLSDETIQKLQNAKEKLSSATTSNEIIEQIRSIKTLKTELELTQNDRLESKVFQIEEIIYRLSQQGVDEAELADSRVMLGEIKQHLSEGTFDMAKDILTDLARQLSVIQDSQ